MHQWTPHPDGDDLVVASAHINPDLYKIRSIDLSMFLTKEIIVAEDLGPGDDVFMIGRFINHDGKERNLPSVRFGAISQMPWEPMRHPSGHLQESFGVEMKSIGGYSGSPVFVYIMPLISRVGKYTGAFGPWLLGVDWGHIYEKQPVLNKFDQPMHDWRVRSNSGMVGVVPAWRLRGLLFGEDFVARRNNRDAAEAARQASGGVALDSTSRSPPANGENPLT